MKKSLEYAYIVDISQHDEACKWRKQKLQDYINYLERRMETGGLKEAYAWTRSEAQKHLELGNVSKRDADSVIKKAQSGKTLRSLAHKIKRAKAKLEQVGKYKVYAYQWLKENVKGDDSIAFGPELCDSPYPVDFIVFNDSYNTPGSYIGRLGKPCVREGTISYKELSDRMRQLTAKEIEENWSDWAEGCVWRCIRENRESVRRGRKMKREKLEIGQNAIRLEYMGDQYFENDNKFEEAYQDWLERLADSAIELLLSIGRPEEADVLRKNKADLLHVVKNAYGCKGDWDPHELAYGIDSEYPPYYEQQYMAEILQQGYNTKIEDDFEWQRNELANLIEGMQMAIQAFELCRTHGYFTSDVLDVEEGEFIDLNDND